MRRLKTILKLIKRPAAAVVAGLLLMAGQSSYVLAQGLSQRQNDLYRSGVRYFDFEAGCAAIGLSAGVSPGAVYFIGDSIGDGAKSKLQEQFSADGWSIEVNTKVGRFPHEAPAIINGDDAGKVQAAKAIVVELGANVDNDMGKQIDDIIGAIKAHNTSAKIFWVNIGSNTNGTGKDGSSLAGQLQVDAQTVAQYSAINAKIQEKAGEKGYNIINWFSKVFKDGDPSNISADLTDDNNYLSNDKLHLSDAGNQALATMVFESLSQGAAAIAPPAAGTTGGATVGGTTGVIDKLPDSVPEPYKTIFETAAAKHGTDVAALAVTKMIETGQYQVPPPATWPGSGAGAQGPFQFIPSTWEAYKEDGDGDGTMSIQSLPDAAHGAAKLLASIGAKKGTPFGDPNNPYAEGDSLVKAWISYNWGPAHVQGKDLPLPQETQNYLKKAVEYYGQIAGLVISGSGASANCSQGGGGLGVSPDGFVFPLSTTKAEIKDGVDFNGKWVWLSDKQECYHHDYCAADIHDDPGTVVVAAKPGTVVSAKNKAGGSGSNVIIKGDDTNLYFYTHMTNGSVSVSSGDKIAAGQALGTIGGSEQAMGTGPHLHIDILPPEYTTRPNCASAACSGLPFLNIQPILVSAFQTLPEQ